MSYFLLLSDTLQFPCSQKLHLLFTPEEYKTVLKSHQCLIWKTLKKTHIIQLSFVKSLAKLSTDHFPRHWISSSLSPVLWQLLWKLQEWTLLVLIKRVKSSFNCLLTILSFHYYWLVLVYFLQFFSVYGKDHHKMKEK